MIRSLYLFLLFAVAFVASQPESDCPIQCRNGGTCAQDRGFHGGTKKSDTNKSEEEDRGIIRGHHCSCPTGYAGSFCEIKYDICEGEERTCFNGSECIRNVDDRGHTFYHCQCDARGSDLSTPEAHQFCQHIWTEFCTAAGESISQGSSSFCTNGGVCKDKKGKSKYHAGCECPPGWAGHHCEIPEDALGEFMARGDHSFFMGFIVFFIVCLVAIVGFFVYHGSRPVRARRTKRGRSRYAAEEQEMNIRSIEFTRAPTQEPDDNEVL